MKFARALANRGADRVVEQLCAGAEPGHLGIEAAEIGIGVAAVLKSVIDAGNGIANPKPIKTQHSGRAKLSRRGAVKRAQELARTDDRYVMLYQYGNDANPRAHYEGTAREIIEDLPDLDVFVAGLGTGGTLTGNARRLKEYNPAIKIVAAEPLQGEGVQGLRSLEDGFVPPVLDQSLLDAKILVSGRDAIRRTRQLKDQEGIFAGPSCGAALHAALRVAASMERGKIVVILADGGWKYLSEDLWTRDLDQLEDDLEEKLLW